METGVRRALPLDVDVRHDGSFVLRVRGDAFVFGGPTAFTADGRMATSVDGTLQLVDREVARDEALCTLGRCRRTTLRWQGRSGVPLEASFEVYDDGVVIFEQHFPKGAEGTAVGGGQEPLVERAHVSTAFPSFVAEDLTGGPAGVLDFNGRFLKSSMAQAWSARTNVTSGEFSGPFVMFTETNEVAVMTSTFSNFPFGSLETAVVGGARVLQLGLLGSVTHVPPGYSLKFVSVVGAGVTDAVLRWGAVLRGHYGKSAEAGYARDLSLRYLGYGTQNGAYYYYHTDGGRSYEETLLGVAAYARESGIPYRYVLLDSWWYEFGAGSGVKRWDARADVFPSGLQALHERTGWALWLHNRRWARDNVYDAANGGSYAFVGDGGDYAVPTEQRLWDDLMRNKSAVGMAVYEQDWLENEFHSVTELLQSPTLARDWLVMMGRAADKVNAAVQYCMEHPRVLLQSLELSAVTQARASDDYKPNRVDACAWPMCMWYQGTSALLLQAIGLAPSKDDFWTTAAQPGNAKYNETDVELHSEFLAAVAAYSTGPVQPSDAIGRSDVRIIGMTSTIGGLLLQPSRPQSAIDACFLEEALGRGHGPVGKYEHICPVLSSHTAIRGVREKWFHVMAAHLKEPFALSARHMPKDVTPGAEYVIWSGYGAADNVTIEGHARSDSAWTMMLPACGASDFRLFHGAPVFGDIALLGELQKWVPVAWQRFSGIFQEKDAMHVELSGDPGEMVTVALYNRPARAVRTYAVVLDAAGLGELRVPITSAVQKWRSERDDENKQND